MSRPLTFCRCRGEMFLLLCIDINHNRGAIRSRSTRLNSWWRNLHSFAVSSIATLGWPGRCVRWVCDFICGGPIASHSLFSCIANSKGGFSILACIKLYEPKAASGDQRYIKASTQPCRQVGISAARFLAVNVSHFLFAECSVRL